MCGSASKDMNGSKRCNMHGHHSEWNRLSTYRRHAREPKEIIRLPLRLLRWEWKLVSACFLVDEHIKRLQGSVCPERFGSRVYRIDYVERHRLQLIYKFRFILAKWQCSHKY